MVVAQFRDPDAMLKSAGHLREDGWSVELHSPFPVAGMSAALGFTEHRVPLLALIGGIVGFVGMLALQIYANLSYPLWVGGRPLLSWPPFVFVAMVIAILCAAVTGIIAMLASNHLPRLHHPLFDADTFHLASDDRFFVSVVLGPGDDRNALGKTLAAFDPERIEDVGGEP